MSKHRLPWFFLFLLMIAVVFQATTQNLNTASIIGQIKDESGAVLPSVTVTTTSPALQLQQVSAISDERGEYRLVELPLGTYEVTYTLPGFQGFETQRSASYRRIRRQDRCHVETGIGLREPDGGCGIPGHRRDIQ